MNDQQLIRTLLTASSRRTLLKAATGATASVLAACVLPSVSPAINQNRAKTNHTSQPGGTMPNPIYVAPDESPVIPLFPGLTVAIKLTHSQTADLFASVDVIVAPKTMGPAPHLHQVLDEIMFVVEGEAHVLVGEEVTVVQTGGWHLRPRGIVHTFWNAGEKPLRFIDIYPNQNFEDFFPELSALLGELMSKGVAPTSPEFLQQMQALDSKWGMTAYYDQRQPIVEKYGLT